MMKNLNIKNRHGFTLIELLIVAFMLGLAMAAIYSLYSAHQRSAYVSDEVVEVQQNLRIALDSMTRDIRVAGLFVPRTLPATNNSLPVDSTLSTGTDITLNTTAGVFATIISPQTGLGIFSVDSAEAVDSFSVGNVVTIVRPQDNNSLPGAAGNTFKVKSTNRAAVPPTIELELNAGADNGAAYGPSDVILLLTGNLPDKVRYCLGPVAGVPGCGPLVATCPAGQQCLMRIVNNIANPIAQNITNLQFTYLLDDGFTETAAPTDFSKIRTVRVTLDGATATTKLLSDNQAKQRRTASIIQIRNRTSQEGGN